MSRAALAGPLTDVHGAIAVEAGGCAPPIVVDDSPRHRRVICLNHFPLELLPAGATAADAKARCDELTALHKARPGVHIARMYWVATVREAIP